MLARKKLGYNIKYVGESEVYHVGGATLNAINPKKTYLNFRNSLFMLTKNAKGSLLFIILTRLLLDGLAGAKFLVELKPKHFLAIIKAHFSFYSNLRRLLNQRKKIDSKINYYTKESIVSDYFLKKNRYYKN